MSSLLVAKSDGTLLLRFDLARRRVVCIGRSHRCDLTLSSAAVSRRHALLFRTPRGWRIVDTGSRHGMHVEGGPALAADLDERTWCRVGPTHLWLDASRDVPPPEFALEDEAATLEDPDAEPGPVLSLLDPRDRPLRRIALRDRVGLLVGSDPLCDVVISDDAVAPLQAVFYREQSRWCVADAGDGTTPLLTDGRRTRRHRLHGGMLLTLGSHRIVVAGPLPRPVADESEQTASPDHNGDQHVGANGLAGDADVNLGDDLNEGTDLPEAGALSAFLSDPAPQSPR